MWSFSTDRTISLILLLSFWIALDQSQLITGYIFCHCDTVECRAAGMRECRAEFYCYTVFQITHPIGTTALEGHADRSDRVVLSRGCVANGLMSMCGKRERPQPSHTVGILTTHCCRDAWCNSDKLFKTVSELDTETDLQSNQVNTSPWQEPNKTGAYRGFAGFPPARHRTMSAPVLATAFDKRPHDVSMHRVGLDSNEMSPNIINRRPSYPADTARERHPTPQSRHQSSAQTTKDGHDWTALFTRPVFITMSVGFVLLILTGLLFLTFFTVCRRYRAHRKPRLQSMRYASATPAYTNKDHAERQADLEPGKLPPSSWTPSAIVYQSTGWTCCGRRSKPDSLYDYCQHDSIRPNKCGTSDSLVDRSPNKVGSRNVNSDATKVNDLRHALIRAPVVPTEQKTSVWIEKQQQQMARLPPPPPSTSQFSASLSPGSSVEFSYPRRLVDNSSTPGASARISSGAPAKPWPMDSLSGPDESLEAIATDAQLWTLYSGPSLDTENSEGRDGQSECTELSSNPSRPPLPQKLTRNMFGHGDKMHASNGNTTRMPHQVFTNSLRKPQNMMDYQRQRGTGATSSGGEESRTGVNDFADWSRRPGTQSASSQSEHSGQKIMLNSLDAAPESGATQSVALNRRSSTKLIALTNFRKAEDDRTDLVTPYAQFQLSPEPSVHDYH